MFGWENRCKAGEWLEVQSRQGSPEKGQSHPLWGSRCGWASAELQETGGVTRTGQPQDERSDPTRKRRERHFCPLWSRFWVGEGEGLRGGSRLMVLGPTAFLVCGSAALLPQGCPHQSLGSSSPLTSTHHPSVRTPEVG